MTNKNKLSILPFIIIALASIAVFVITIPYEPVPRSKDEIAWKTYINEKYGFKIDYPAEGWAVFESDTEIEPKFNFYRLSETSGVITEPLIHHSTFSHVSVFPQGIGTEGIFGKSRPSTLQFLEETRGAIDFILENGDVWGTYVPLEKPSHPKRNMWNDFAFLFANARPDNFIMACLKPDGKETSETECDLMAGNDTLIRRGNVDPALRQIEEKMLRSFQFIDSLN